MQRSRSHASPGPGRSEAIRAISRAPPLVLSLCDFLSPVCLYVWATSNFFFISVLLKSAWISWVCEVAEIPEGKLQARPAVYLGFSRPENPIKPV